MPEQKTPMGRQRLRSALTKKPSRSQLVVAVLLALVGFAGVTQVRANEVDDSYSGLRQQDLIDVLSSLAGTSQRADAEIERLTRTRERLQSDTSRRQAALEQAKIESDSLSVLAGLVPVTGPGVRITITEGDESLGIGAILDTVQELRTVGAEAIQFNGQVRVVAQTSFEDGVGGILVDDTLVEPPYVIDAIGESSVLSGAINFALGPRQQIESAGGDVDVEVLTSLDIESVRRPEQPDFAAPAPGQ